MSGQDVKMQGKKRENRIEVFAGIAERCRYYRSTAGFWEAGEAAQAAKDRELSAGQVLAESRSMPGSFSTLLCLYDREGRECGISRQGIRFSRNSYPKQGRFHRHQYVELFYVAEGSFEQILLGEHQHFEQGEIVITDRNCEHADYLTKQDSTVLFLCLAPEFLDSLLDSYETTDTLQRFLFHALSRQKQEQSFLRLRAEMVPPEMNRVLEQLVQEDHSREPGWEAIIRGNLIRLFSLLCTHYALQLHSSSQEAKEKVLVYELERYIRLHFTDVTAGTLEEVFHYHRNYYNFLMKKHRGVGFQEYVQGLRMERACELLRTTNYPVRQIAAMAGYANNSFFHHLFQRHTGFSPGDYRRNCRRINRGQEE